MNNLEKRLRAELRNQRHVLASWPDAAGKIAAATARRRRRRRLLAVATLAVALAAAVPLVLRFGTPSRPTIATSEPAAPVPWLDLPATPPSPTSAAGRPTAAACAAADLSAAVAGGAGAAGGHIGYRVTVRNVGQRRCTLTGPAVVSGTDLTSGAAVTLTSGELTFFDRSADERPPTLDPGESAVLTIIGASGCNGGANAHEYRFTKVTVAGRADSLRDVTLTVSCRPQVGPWARPVPEPETSPSTDTEAYRQLRVRIDAPATAAPGTPMRYVVTLTNPTDTRVRLDPCPAYTEGLSKVVASYQLNCEVEAIAAHASVRFAMVLPLPNDRALLPSGEANLSWNLGFPGDRTVTASVPVSITD